MTSAPQNLQLDLFSHPALRHQNCAALSRLYFALLPPSEIVAEASRLSSNIRNVYHLAEQERPGEVLHVSLMMMSRLYQQMPPYLIDRALAVGDAVQAESFSVSFDRAASFGKKGRPAVVLFPRKGLSAGVQTLRRKITEAALQRRLPATRKATAHMTLVYSRTIVPEIPLTPPFEWTARDFVLVQSFYGETRHEYLRRWPLAAPAPDGCALASDTETS